MNGLVTYIYIPHEDKLNCTTVQYREREREREISYSNDLKLHIHSSSYCRYQASLAAPMKLNHCPRFLHAHQLHLTIY